MGFAGRHLEKPRQTSVRITGPPDHKAVVLYAYLQSLVGTPGVNFLGIWKNERNLYAEFKVFLASEKYKLYITMDAHY